MVKNYLSKFLLICLLLTCQTTTTVLASDNFSELYVKITDATTALQSNNQQQVQQLIKEIEQQFQKTDNYNSEAGKKVQNALKINNKSITKTDLVELSSALLAFEKEQNPIDIEAERKKLKTKLTPSLEELKSAITNKDLQQVKMSYKKFNMIWANNEGIVRNSSTVHYGKIETAISFFRSSLEATPTDFAMMTNHYEKLMTALDDFINNKQSNVMKQQYTLSEGITLLQQGYDAFVQQDITTGKNNIERFIEIWPTIEGDVRTRDAQLYKKIESQLPVIMVKGQEDKYQQQLQQLIKEISAINMDANYSFVDAMLILLREGIEALLIVLALASTLKAAKQTKGLVWVYSGALLGIMLSIVIAIILQQVFPNIASGMQREIIEGVVGVIAVVMMIIIGMWLHSKSSVKAWNAFMDRQMNMVLTSGSFLSMFFLSFLAVFREGAETILFYAGILPKITFSSLILGICSALIILVIIGYMMIFATRQFAPYKLFFILTWFIYFLAFKMLGVSIYTLQFTNVLPRHIITSLPTIEWLGIYPTLETLGSQLLFIVVIIIVRRFNKA